MEIWCLFMPHCVHQHVKTGQRQDMCCHGIPLVVHSKRKISLNTIKSRQNGQYFANHIFYFVFMSNKNIFARIVLMSSWHKPAFIQFMSSRRRCYIWTSGGGIYWPIYVLREVPILPVLSLYSMQHRVPLEYITTRHDGKKYARKYT